MRRTIIITLFIILILFNSPVGGISQKGGGDSYSGSNPTGTSSSGSESTSSSGGGDAPIPIAFDNPIAFYEIAFYKFIQSEQTQTSWWYDASVFLATWTYYLSGYSGLKSYFYSKEEEGGAFGIYRSELVNAILNGIEGWSDYYCRHRSEILMSSDAGVGFNQGFDTIGVSISAEKTKFTNVSSGETLWLYKLSYFVDLKCDDVSYNLYVYDKKGNSKALYRDSQSNKSVYYTGINSIVSISKKDWEKICISFESFKPYGCIETEEPYATEATICNLIIDTEEYGLEEMNYEDFFGGEENNGESNNTSGGWDGFG